MPPTGNKWLRDVTEFISSGEYYHWDTPRYRELCAAGGLDPDRGRPVFKPEFKEIGDKLVIEMNSRNDNNHDLWSVIFDVIDIMRADIPADPDAVAKLRRSINFRREHHPALLGEMLEVLTRLGIDVGQITIMLTGPMAR